MARQGPLLFGQHFDVSPERLQRWDRATRGQSTHAATPTDKEAGRSDLPPAVLVAGAR